MRGRDVIRLALLLPLLVGAETPEGGGEPSIAELTKKALELEAREAALRTLEGDILAKIEELSKLRHEASLVLGPIQKEAEDERKRLVSFYQAMKPKAAAELLEKLPVRLAAEVLSAMPARQAAKILNVLKANRAVQISKLMAGK